MPVPTGIVLTHISQQSPSLHAKQYCEAKSDYRTTVLTTITCLALSISIHHAGYLFFLGTVNN